MLDLTFFLAAIVGISAYCLSPKQSLVDLEREEKRPCVESIDDSLIEDKTSKNGSIEEVLPKISYSSVPSSKDSYIDSLIYRKNRFYNNN